MTQTELASTLRDLPDLHVRLDKDGKPFFAPGGFDFKHLAWISETLDQHMLNYQEASVIESGAGRSTILFLAKGFGNVTSIAPDLLLERNILRYCTQRGIKAHALDFRSNRSEFELPRLVESRGPQQRFDVAFIDGDHGWPNVFVDFCYMNFMLRTGGLIFFDDCYAYSVRECVNFLSEEPGWSIVRSWSKLTVFKRNTDERITSGAGRRYLARKTQEMPRDG